MTVVGVGELTELDRSSFPSRSVEGPGQGPVGQGHTDSWIRRRGIDFWVILPTILPIVEGLSKMKGYFGSGPGPGSGEYLSCWGWWVNVSRDDKP